ncbi:MAG: hypothetical protein SPI35_06865 [Porphyromonas sp.]|nr:hypothetical protein [Porphyromonas sp.]
MKITLFDRTVGRMGILLCVLSLLSGCGKRGDQLTPQEKSTRISLDFEAGIANDNPQLKMSAIQLDADLDQKYFPKLKLNVGETVDGHLLIREKNGGETVHKQDITLEAKLINGVTKLCHKSTFDMLGYNKDKEYLACVIVGGMNLYQNKYGYGYQPFLVDPANKTLNIGGSNQYLNIPYTTVWSKLSFNAQDEASIRDEFCPRGFLLRVQVENTSGAEISVLGIKPTETTSLSNMVCLDITQVPKEGTLPYFSEYYSSPSTNLTMPESIQSQSLSNKFIFLWLGYLGEAKPESIPLTVSYYDMVYYAQREARYNVKTVKDGQTKYLKLKI